MSTSVDRVVARMKDRVGNEDARRLGIKCPKCEGILVETDFDDVKIDVCDRCSGVWLDAGELAEVIDKEDERGWFGRLFS